MSANELCQYHRVPTRIGVCEHLTEDDAGWHETTDNNDYVMSVRCDDCYVLGLEPTGWICYRCYLMLADPFALPAVMRRVFGDSRSLH